MKTGYDKWLHDNYLKICTECKVVLSKRAFGWNKGLLRPNCTECHSKKKVEWMRGQRASLGDSYIRALLRQQEKRGGLDSNYIPNSPQATHPDLLRVKRLQLQLHRLTK